MKKFLFVLPVLLVFGCSDPENPNRARFNNRGCLECDKYAVGETFLIGGLSYTVADRMILEAAINSGLDLSRYCTSKITDMSSLFKDLFNYNQDISTWDVSNVTNMQGMFWSASSFNQEIGNWDVSNVDNMNSMFKSATVFNQYLNEWNVEKVVDMSGMFLSACWLRIPIRPPSYRWI